MSKQREAFEAWAEPQGVLLGRLVSDERYESMTTEWAFRAWKASRAAALEEAATLIATMIERGYGPGLMPEMLRALKEQS